MTLEKIEPTNTKAWKELQIHYEEMKNVHMKDMFSENPARFKKFSLELDDLLVDFSKNIINEKTLNLFFQLAEEVSLKSAIEKMFKGEAINETEQRAVLHTALRNRDNSSIYLNDHNIMLDINAVLKQMKDFSDRILSSKWKGYTGRKITDIVNIGIGGSDLGPRMVTKALKPYQKEQINVHFVSNIDGTHINETLKPLNPESTLFMIASKSFTTLETMTNAYTARDWFLAKSKNKNYIKKHFIAISTNEEEVKKFGIDINNMFKFWEWVGGRYSLWSAIGLPIACSIGFDNFEDLLKGAYIMDKHFRKAPFSKNIPVILALIGIWYSNFFNAKSLAILPYDQYLELFPSYLQQTDMESNGKSIDRAGNKINYQTGPIIWGQPGTNGQHAFYQLIHQGTKMIPCDFLAPAISHNQLGDHHSKLLANFFAQTKALMKGRNEKEILQDLYQDNTPISEIGKILPYKVFAGNKPSNSILFKKLTPKTLGMMIAMYEHKIFVQGVIWNIFSFDQWGVELGKKLAKDILPELKNNKKSTKHDSSTNGLINKYKNFITSN